MMNKMNLVMNDKLDITYLENPLLSTVGGVHDWAGLLV